jgi:hypothetical protein
VYWRGSSGLSLVVAEVDKNLSHQWQNFDYRTSDHLIKEVLGYFRKERRTIYSIKHGYKNSDFYSQHPIYQRDTASRIYFCYYTLSSDEL